jgi:hypothetical protein
MCYGFRFQWNTQGLNYYFSAVLTWRCGRYGSNPEGGELLRNASRARRMGQRSRIHFLRRGRKMSTAGLYTE